MLRLRDFLSRRGDPLQLEALTGDLGLDRQMPEAEVASPGLALAGYTGRFAPNRIHVFGETEITYLNSLSQEERQGTLQKFFGFDKNGAYADMSVQVDLDALAMTWSVSGAAPQAPAGKHFRRDLLGEAAGEARRPGPLLRLPDTPTRIEIDPRRLVQ